MNPTDDRRQRGAQLVRDRGKKFILRAAGGFGFTPGSPLFLKQSGIVDGQRHTERDQFQQARVIFGEREMLTPANMNDTEHAPFQEQGHTQQRFHSALFQERCMQVCLLNIIDCDRRFLGGDASGEAGSHRHVNLHVKFESLGRPGHQRVV